MIQTEGDLWQMPGDARVITTNGTILTSRRGVMGRGVAKQAAQRYLGCAQRLGRYLQRWGNHTGVLIEAGEETDTPLVVLPVKHAWHEPADVELILRSLDELVALTEVRGWRRVVLPRPGCGSGQLYWIDIEPLVEARLDDRFLVLEKSSIRGLKKA